MKKLLLLSILLVSLVAGYSQDKRIKVGPVQPPNSRLSDILVIPKNLDTTKKEGRIFLDQLRKLRQSHSATYSHTTPLGKVYRLRPGNMACLVPDLKQLAPMPGSEGMPMPPSNMPTPGKRENIIPKK